MPSRLQLESGAGVQARARSARYAELQRVRAAVGASAIAVGHTLDDQAETVLGRLLRGSGVRRLRGILPAREDGVVRPLIDVSRASVQAYLEERGNALWVSSDPSNHDPCFTRVRLRATTLPALREEDADVVRHLAALADDARDLVALAESAGRRLLVQATKLGVEGHIDVLVDVLTLREAEPAARREALRQMVEVRGVSCRRSHLQELERAVAAGPGAHVLVGGGVSFRRVGTDLIGEGLRPTIASGGVFSSPLGVQSGTHAGAGGLRPGSEETTKMDV